MTEETVAIAEPIHKALKKPGKKLVLVEWEIVFTVAVEKICQKFQM